MDRKIEKIRGRYDDGSCGVPDHQMFRDIHSLLGYIDQMHRRMVEQAAEEAVQAAFHALEECADQRVH